MSARPDRLSRDDHFLTGSGSTHRAAKALRLLRVHDGTGSLGDIVLMDDRRMPKDANDRFDNP